MQNKPSTPTNHALNPFVEKNQNDVTGILHGFDRLRLRGCLRQLYCSTVMEAYLSVQHILLKEFGTLVKTVSQQIAKATEALAQKLGRPVVYVNSSARSKEALARDIAARDGIKEGMIAVLSCLEPCRSYSLRGNAQTKHLELHLEGRRCLHYYFYFEHPKFGFMHLRLQTWFPFQVDVCLNGRHWLAKQLDAAKVAYRKRENCLVWVEDMERAQQLLDEQVHLDWPKELEGLLKQCHPTAPSIARPLGLSYYWSASESEYASDVLFRSPEALARLYPSLVHHAVSSFGSQDVMRFLGRKVPTQTGQVHWNFKGEIISDLKHRPEGIRVKHSLSGNSIKLYDKQGSVLRVETTLNRPQEFRVWRRAEAGGRTKNKAKAWRVLRRGVADMDRRAEVSRASNERYFGALASVSETVPLFEWTRQVCRPIKRNGRRYRGINPLSPEDGQFLEAISRGEFSINGFRNRDVRGLLWKGRASAKEQRRRAGRVTRRLALLRAHGLVRKISGTHRYVVTDKGRITITALLAARQADVSQLTKLAA
jgi:hypothetical protein